MADAPQWWETIFDDGYVAAWTAAGAFDRSAQQVDEVAAVLPADTGLDILDVPCGFGRIAAPLHARGHRVTGVDLSADQLRIAEERNPGPVYVRGDMRTPPPGPYDVVLNLYSSFGYFADRSDDRVALRAWFDVLRPGGLLVMDLMHRDGVAYLLGKGEVPIPDGPVRETGETDWVTGRRSATVTFGEVSKSFEVNLYTATELVDALRGTGYSSIAVSGDLQGTEPFSPATRLVIRARK